MSSKAGQRTKLAGSRARQVKDRNLLETDMWVKATRTGDRGAYIQHHNAARAAKRAARAERQLELLQRKGLLAGC